MIKKVLLFLVLNIVFGAAVVSVYAIGYEYDKAHRLYPESKLLSYDLSMQVYGERWARIAKVLLGLGLLADAVLILTWHRKHQNNQRHILDLHANI